MNFVLRRMASLVFPAVFMIWPQQIHALQKHITTAEISSEQRQAIMAIGTAVHQDGDFVAKTLQSMGFPPNDANATWSGWTNWPVPRQIDTAYRSAQVNGDGDLFLQQFVRRLAKTVDALRDVPKLAGYFDEPRQSPLVLKNEDIHFSSVFGEEASKPLSQDAQEQIREIARHIGHLSRGYLMGRCCDVTDDESHRIQLESRSDSDAFERAVGLHPPPPSITDKIRLLADAAISENPALGHQPSILRILDVRPDITSNDPGLGLIPSAGFNVENAGTVEALKAAEAERYRNFEARTYSAPGARSFNRMIVRSAGFGGVIFGNRVTAEPKLAKPKAISFTPSDTQFAAHTSPGLQETWGWLNFQMSDETVLRSHLFRADTVRAAKRIAWEGYDAGVGFGLVGLRAKVYSSLDDTWLYSYYVNPAIIDTRLGRTMLLVDTLPQEGDIFLDLLRSAKVSDRDIEATQSVLSAKLGQYKIIDVPLFVQGMPGGVITVSRQPDQSYPSVALRQEAYITLSSFCVGYQDEPCRGQQTDDGDRPRAESALPFYPTVPALVSSLEPFDRANEFAEAFALLRWAVAEGASWSGSDVPAETLPPVTAVLVQHGNFQFVPSRELFLLQRLEELFAQARQVAVDGGA